MSHWKAGDKAVCVAPFVSTYPDGSLCKNTAPNGDPKVGTTYLVGGVFSGSKILLGLIIAGHPSISPCGADVGWNAAKFRKVVTASEREAIGMERLMEDLLR